MSTTMTFLGVFTVPAGKGKLEKMSIRTSSIYMAPATVALQKLSFRQFFRVSHDIRHGRHPPFPIPIENRFSLSFFLSSSIRDFFNARKNMFHTCRYAMLNEIP
jgi:hypothetical protein